MATSASRRLKSSEEMFDYSCSLCEKKNKNSEAVKYCQECLKHLCSSCLELHNHFMEDHTLVEPSAAGSLVVMPTERCKQHGGEVVKLWCKQHDEVLCNTCVTIDHRFCEVKFIPGHTDKLLQDPDLRQTISDMKRAKERLARLKKERNIAGKELLDEKKKYMDMVDQYQRKIIKKVEILANAAKEEIDGWYEENSGKIDVNKSDCDQMETETMTCISQLENSSENKSQLFVTMKKGQKLLTTIGDFVGQNDFNWKHENKFEIDQGLEGFFGGLKSVGSFKKRITLYKASETKTVNVNIAQDSDECRIIGMCLLFDSSVLLLDYGHKKLRRLDSSTITVTDTCDLSASPMGACCVGASEVAVCLGDNKIQFVSVGSTMALSRSIAVQHNCFGIGYGDGELFVSDADKTVYVYDLAGTLLRTINREEMFSDSRHLAVSGDKIYIADTKRGFVCTDRHGTELYRYKGNTIKYGYGVCTDGQGGVFLCCIFSGNVVQVGANGEEMGVVLCKADDLLTSLCFDTNKQKLFVSGQNSNWIVVADLV